MDASQYKEFILFLLFIKYVSDKWGGQLYAPITVHDWKYEADTTLVNECDITIA